MIVLNIKFKHGMEHAQQMESLADAEEQKARLEKESHVESCKIIDTDKGGGK